MGFLVSIVRRIQDLSEPLSVATMDELLVLPRGNLQALPVLKHDK